MEAVDFRRHGCEKRHGQPVQELRVGTLDLDAIRMVIHNFNATERIFPQIYPRFAIAGLGQPFVYLLERIGVFLKTHDVVTHQAEYG